MSDLKSSVGIPLLQEQETTLMVGAQALGVVLTDPQLHQFRAYYQELVNWNRRINLTGITDYQEVLSKHFLDSLTVLLAIDRWRARHRAPERPRQVVAGVTLLDVGTGAGLPGLPLRVVRPDLQVTLLDSVSKKTTFLRYLLSRLGIEDVAVITGRAENLAHNPLYRGAFDLVVSRAVDKLATLAEYMLPFCRVGGLAIAMKKGDITAETAGAQGALDRIGGELQEILPVHAPGLEDGRQLVVLEKVYPTPQQYPRRAGVPAKRPL